MKSYTDLEQSKKLDGIIPIESADGYWFKGFPAQPYMVYTKGTPNPGEHIPCWSLAALLDILNNKVYFIDEDASVNLSSYKTVKWDLLISNSGLVLVTESDPIDACVEMIYKLKERNLI